MNRKKQRVLLISLAGIVLVATVSLILVAMRDQIVFFYSPSDIVEKGVEPGARIRLGGLVADGSVTRQDGSSAVRFDVTDTARTISVEFNGILPDLFREGQGVVAEGAIDASGTFRADNVLAKHDETYMPREVADSLREQGHWQGEERASK